MQEHPEEASMVQEQNNNLKTQKNREVYWEREDRRQRQLEHIIDYQEKWHTIEKNIMAEQMIESTKNMLKRKNENKLRASK